MNQLSNHVNVAIPVVAGLVVGIAFVIAMALAMTPDTMLSDEALIAKYSKIAEVRYFLEKYPDAQVEVERISSQQATMVYFEVAKQVEPASEWNSGINVLRVSAYKDKLAPLALGIGCGTSQELAGLKSIFYYGVGIADVSNIDAWEERCFQTSGISVIVNGEVFEPDTSGDELNNDVYQFAFGPEE